MPFPVSRLIESALFYDVVQVLAGNITVQRRLSTHLAQLPPGACIVDVGGGTGAAVAAERRYVCIDLDLEKLRRFRVKRPQGFAVAGDAGRCPIASGAADVVMCAKVTHHLTDDQLSTFFAEAQRILRPDGVIIIADAIRTARAASRVLWRLDRGSYPRSIDEMTRLLPSTLTVQATDRFSLPFRHDFVVWVARAASARRS